MSDATFTLDVISAESKIFSGDVRFAIMPGCDGELGIYPRHTPLLTMIKPGVVQYQKPESQELDTLFVSGGILEVQPNVVTVLADTAIRGHDLDEAKAEEAIRSAREKMQDQTSKIDYAKAQSELAEAIAQINAIHKLRGKK